MKQSQNGKSKRRKPVKSENSQGLKINKTWKNEVK
jgi:hypothetical protein